MARVWFFYGGWLRMVLAWLGWLVGFALHGWMDGHENNNLDARCLILCGYCIFCFHVFFFCILGILLGFCLPIPNLLFLFV